MKLDIAAKSKPNASREIIGSIVKNNIFVFRNNKTLALSSQVKWEINELKTNGSDYNLFYYQNNSLLKSLNIFPNNSNITKWNLNNNMDIHSIFDNPLFIDENNGNYKLKKKSPAFTKIHFEKIPLIKAPESKCGNINQISCLKLLFKNTYKN